MRKRTGVALAAAGVVAGLVIGSLGIAMAASSTSTSSTATTQTPGPGGGGRGFGGRGFGHGGGAGDLASSVATLTGMSVQDVMTQRQAGKSYADIAKAKDVSSDEVVAQALKDATVMYDAMVKIGRMTADQEKQALADLKTRLESEVTSTAQFAAGGRGMRGGPGGLASSVASLTGTSVDDVMTQRQAGKSFAEIAKAKGVSASEVVARALKDATANLKSMFESEVNATGQTGPGFGGHGGWDGAPPGAAPTSTPSPTN